jgi:DNA polymerase II large subunit
MDVKQYFKSIDKKVKDAYRVAEEARKMGIDPVSKVEVPVAKTLAEKCVGLISTMYPQVLDKKIVDRILDLEREYGSLDPTVAFTIAEEIAREKFCKFKDLLEAIDAGIRVGFSYLTIGVVSSPLEGFTQLKVGKTRKGEDYLIAYFSGPIRSAGTTASCMVLMLIDYLRETFGFAKYDPDEIEVKRYVTENYDYHDYVTNLQYLPTGEEITFLAKNLPIQISGEPTEQREVSNYKDLDRVESNFIRGGMCLIFSEGLAQKAQKGLGLWRSVQKNGLNATSWEFLDEFLEIKNKKEKGKSDNSPTYIKDLVAGRPVFGHPGRSGGFRFRYGKSRSNGFSSASVHPATMTISGGFISAGTQFKIEKPTKGCIVTSCDEIDGPIVKLKNGSVRRVDDFKIGKELYPQVQEILYLGDILFPFGDVLNRNYDLLKPAWVEEWWYLDLKKRGFKGELDKLNVEFKEAKEFSKVFNVPLYPKYIFYWKEISNEEFLGMLDWLGCGKNNEGKIILPYSKIDSERFKVGKRALELLGVEHEVSLENVILKKREAEALLFNLGLNELKEESFRKILEKVKIINEKEVLEIVNELCIYKIKDKSGTFIGSRMGRPEKAKLRKLTGSPHVLFPVGDEGGRLRSFQSAMDVGSIKSDFLNYYCDICNKERVYPKCDECNGICKKRFYCHSCEKYLYLECREEGHRSFESGKRRIEIRNLFANAKKIAKVRAEEIPIVKGVRGTNNKDHSCEHLAKGLLRSKYNLQVNKDGTIRYDMTEMALTHFKPNEIGTSLQALRKLGYDKDIFGKKLKEEDQILEMMPHDVVLPRCPDTLDEKADDVFWKITKFIDDELEYVYQQKRYFNLKTKEGLIGEMVVCIAPHICTATVGRIIGFSKTQGLMASPYMHAAMRRDCDGDEAAAMLLMDLLLNFSRNFLPAHRGGTQDSPLVLNTEIKAGDVDDQILDVEVGDYPLELYEKAEQGKHSSEVKIEMVKDRLKNGEDPFTNLTFTHGTNDFNDGVVNTAYKLLPTMAEKVSKMMELCKKIRAVDTKHAAQLIVERHFIRDTRGNLRKFSMQKFRCVGCNSKFRRPPLAGKCDNCGGRIIFTISEGSILKYMQPALNLARDYKVNKYILESLELTEMYIHSIFGKDPEKQEQLKKWF